MKTTEDSIAQSKHGEPQQAPGPSFEPVPPKPRWTLETGVRSILLVDILALLLILASGPAAYLWLDSSRPGPLATTAIPSMNASPAAPAVAPGAGGSVAPGASPGLGSSAAPTAGTSRKIVYGEDTWTRTDPLPQAKWAAASVVLPDGRVMVVGGATASSSFDAVASAAIFDPSTGHWSRVTDMLQPRA